MISSFRTSILRNLGAFIFAGAVSAQMDLKALAGNLSPDCQVGAGTLITGDFSTCANLMSLINVLGTTGSLVDPLDTWVSGVCSAPACPASTLTAAASSVQTSCGPDAQKGVTTAAQLISLVANFPSIRTSFCLQYKSNQTRCGSSILHAAEKAAGRPLSLVELMGFIGGEGLNILASAASSNAKDIFCNDCGHALYTTLPRNSSAFSGAASSASSASGQSATDNQAAFVVATCGASFADGKIPDTIVSSGSQNNVTSDNKGSPAATGAQSSANVITIPVFTVVACILLAMML